MNAQSFQKNAAIDVGYVYFNSNFFKIGGKYFFDKSFSSIGLSSNIGCLSKKTIVIPELTYTYYITDENRSTFDSYHFIFTQFSLSPKTVTPKVGWSFATFFEVAAGYGIQLDNSEYYVPKGLRVDVSVVIPLYLKIF
ncbi:hypothetical protein ACFSX9_06480 [Flavobacterium ardleyense]|uniref:Uncharacterized protein n=1 Tax=Flavobacterium ardleyense TaxID=2038737 RepID=A0ABW5Z8G3_9FLAO